MSIPITSVQTTGISVPEIAKPAGAGGKSGEFQSVLSTAIATVDAAQRDAGRAVERFLNGEGEELHSVILATQRAELQLELGMQIRNKVVQAYQEIMRMQL